MFVAAAVCPATPLLVPAVAAGAAPELAELRDACARALDLVLGTGADHVLVVASGEPRTWPGAAASFQRLGVAGPPADDRPLALQVGRHLLDGAGWHGVTSWYGVDGTTALSGGDARTAVLCLGDGSARRSPPAPGYLHPDAAVHDQRVAAALATGDTAALLALEPGDDERLLVDGRCAWQALARTAAGCVLDARLLRHEAPYGVGYLVATWRRVGA